LNDVYSSISGSVNIKVSKPLTALNLKRNNVYRYSLLLTAKARKEINSVVKQINNKFFINIPSTVKMCFDIDPFELA
ncbi:primosomal protein N', partial [Francisella tularensis subsp. holarctica]|nr:primosomal protein N' [Francisella tularensis subsp. holarctica]